MKMVIITENWAIDNDPTVLHQIHENDKNIAIYERDVQLLKLEVDALLAKNIELRAIGDLRSISQSLMDEINELDFPLISKDIRDLLSHFKDVTKAKSFRLLLATVNTNMCRKFHTDINDLRLLCTYSGPGTLWLTEDNINHKALVSNLDNDSIVLDESRIQQAKTGSVIILKGAIYPKEGTSPIVHRSPTIEETGQKRLLLRIDTNEFLNFG